MGVVARATGVLVNRDPSDTACGSRWTPVAGIRLAKPLVSGGKRTFLGIELESVL